VAKPNGTKVRYYLFNEYELHYNEIPPKSEQDWHHHEKISESLLVLDGKLILQWKEKGNLKQQAIHDGDLIEMENTPHNVVNNGKKTAKVIILKQVLSGKNRRALFKKDKIGD